MICDLEYNGADILKLKFEGYNTSEKVVEFSGCRVFMTTPVSGSKEDQQTGELTGYSVLTAGKMKIGTIEKVIQNPGQWLLSVVTDTGKTVLIPLHENLVIKIDNEKKLLFMDLPEGLTEIN